MKLSIFLLSALLLLASGCSTTALVKTKYAMPSMNEDVNASEQDEEDLSLSLFRLSNYTDTPRAGMRAANILEGILLTKGFDVVSHIQQTLPTKKEAREIALADGSKYFMYGGVSEWRYKTGIDGEPAVSIVCSLYETDDDTLIWSATGADSDWGNSSIGLTAQNLLETMIDN